MKRIHNLRVWHILGFLSPVLLHRMLDTIPSASAPHEIRFAGFSRGPRPQEKTQTALKRAGCGAVPLAILLSVLFFAVAWPAAASAQTREDVCEGVNFTGAGVGSGSGDSFQCDPQDPEGSGEDVGAVVEAGVNIFSAIVGVIAVAMIMFGGFKYITAGGDSSRIQSAQQTIIYAVIGLVVVALAQIMVRFVIATAS